MKNHSLARRVRVRLLVVVAAMPLLAGSTCAERSIEFLLGSGFLEDFRDDRDNDDDLDDILDDIEDLWDDVF